MSQEKDANDTTSGAVATTILNVFLTQLAKEEGLAEVEQRLRKVILDDGVYTEPAIRSALFKDTA